MDGVKRDRFLLIGQRNLANHPHKEKKLQLEFMLFDFINNNKIILLLSFRQISKIKVVI